MSKLSRIVLLVLLVIVGGGIDSIFANTSSVSVTVAVLECSDGLDNDSDSLTDYPFDPGCSSANDNDETDPPTPSLECNDGIDNDNDSETDYPDDLGCDSLTDTGESGEITSGGGNGPVGGIGSPIITYTGTQVTFHGVAFPGATIYVLGDGMFLGSSKALSDGKFNVLISEITPGVYNFNLYATNALGKSTRSQSFSLKILRGSIVSVTGIIISEPDALLPFKLPVCVARADVNGDCKVDIVDFSIVAYWWDRVISGDFVQTEKGELNGDGVISLEDFSILAYYWTG